MEGFFSPPAKSLCMRLDSRYNNSNDPVSGYAGIPRNMTGIATKMKEAGYATHMVGKWHAGGATPDHIPTERIHLGILV